MNATELIAAVVATMDEQKRSSADIAERIGLPIAQVGPVLQALAVHPLRGISTARGRRLEEITKRADQRLVAKHYISEVPSWSRRAPVQVDEAKHV